MHGFPRTASRFATADISPCGDAIDASRERAKPETIVNTERRTTTAPVAHRELGVTARRVARRCLPGGQAGAPSHVDLAQLGAVDSGDDPHLWTESNVGLLEAMLIARVRLDDIEGALDLVHAHFSGGKLRARTVLGLDTLASLFAAVAEAYAAAGRPRDAGTYAARALTFAGSDPVRYRAEAVQALIFALNGEFDAATATADRCDDLALRNGWGPLDTDYDLALAQLLLAAAAFDGGRLGHASSLLRTIAPHDPYAQHAASTADAIGRIIGGDLVAGAAALRAVIGGSAAHLSHRVVRDLALSVLADVTLAQRGARRALSLLDGHGSASSHTVCFDAQRAAAHLALGDDRAALDVTDGCLELGSEHCPRTLASVLVRRAVARERLGQSAAADDLFDEGCALALHAGDSIAPFVTVPQSVLARLFDRLGRRRPNLDDRIASVRERLHRWHPDAPAPALPALTPRESSVALALRSGTTYAEIADSFVVSINTVKSQMRSLFLKLGVSTREDAVDLLERQGFYL